MRNSSSVSSCASTSLPTRPRGAWVLRKGTLSGVGSSDLQATYPLNRLSPGFAGYLMVQYFTGYGETLLNYNQREPWSLRFGYAISR